jgi:beta-glucosidase
VRIDGTTVVELTEAQHGGSFYGLGSPEVRTAVALEGGRSYEVEVDYPPAGNQPLRGLVVGGRAVPAADHIEQAAAVAADAEVAVVIVGTNDDWETEGHDRTSMDLPGGQDELVRAVCAANRRTAVVVNAGAPVTLPWADEAPALLDVWFGGQEMAEALADVLTGRADPSGRLPVTFPERVEHAPAHGNFPGDGGVVRYGEGVLVGYRWYEARHLPVRFPFGHGLSYTTFSFGEPEVIDGDPMLVRVRVSNTGARSGGEVVQLYVEPVDPEVVRPPKELKAFAKVWLDPGESTTAELTLDSRAFACWHPLDDEWQVAPGRYELHVGRSSADVAHVVTVER